jgi:TonB family protein
MIKLSGRSLLLSALVLTLTGGELAAAGAERSSGGTFAAFPSTQRTTPARRTRRRKRPRHPAITQPSPEHVIIVPNPELPRVKNPSLSVPPTIQADPLLLPPDPHPIPYGDPATPPQGMGTGMGIGPGRGTNVGTGDPYISTSDGGDVDQNRVYAPQEVDRKAVITSKPEAGWTEEARKNQVSGVVRLRVILSHTGQVTNIAVYKGLPDGLTEKAIAAARQIKFTPAQKGGKPVSQKVTLEYNFFPY